jgi:hypothetical protein
MDIIIIYFLFELFKENLIYFIMELNLKFFKS